MQKWRLAGIMTALAAILMFQPLFSHAEETEPAEVSDWKEFQDAIKQGQPVRLIDSISIPSGKDITVPVDLNGKTLRGEVVQISAPVSNGNLDFSRIHLAGGRLDCSTGSSAVCSMVPVSVAGNIICITGYDASGQLVSDDPDPEGNGWVWTVVTGKQTLAIVEDSTLGTIWYDLTGAEPSEIFWEITYLNAAGEELSGLSPSSYRTSELETKLATTYMENGTTFRIESYLGPYASGIIPKQTSGAVTVMIGEVSLDPSAGQQNDRNQFSGFSGGVRRSGGVSGSGLSSALSASESDAGAERDGSSGKTSSSDTVSESVSSASSFLSSGGGRRVRNANASVRSTLSLPLPVMDLSEVSARLEAQKKAGVPAWETVLPAGLILSGLIGLFFLIRKNSRERTAETYEKLHIKQ